MGRHRGLAIGLAGVAALAFAGSAGADRIRVHFTAAGEAAARAGVLTQADVGAADNWRGGARSLAPAAFAEKPTGCNARTRRSDLILNGAAKAFWAYIPQLTTVQNEVDVLETAAMASLDWKRTLVALKARACVLLPGRQLISFKPFAFPRLTWRQLAYRAVLDVPVTGGTLRVSAVVVEFVVGRTEASIAVGGPSANSGFISATSIRLARVLFAKVGGRAAPQPTSPLPRPVLRNVRRCGIFTAVELSQPRGPVGTPLTIDISAVLEPWYGYSLYQGTTRILNGSGFPFGAINVVVKGRPGTSITFTIVREFPSGGPSRCSSGSAQFVITKGVSSPPPPETPRLPACSTQTTMTLSQSSGRSPTPITLSFPPPTDTWDGYQLYEGTAAIGGGTGFPPNPLPVVVKGVVGQKIIFVLVRSYTNVAAVEPTCIAASATFTITG